MSEFLPGIDIAISVTPREFLERMAVIGEQSGHFAVERHYDAIKNGALDIVNFRLLGSNSRTGTGAQLIARDDRVGRILIEMHSDRWDPDPPTRASYCAAAEEQVRPMLRAYNRIYASRYRLRVQRPSSREPKLSVLTTTLFDRFAILANTSSLHPYDWARFNALVREGRQEIPDYQLRTMLIKAGFSKEKAETLADLYFHLWAFKSRKL